MNMIAGMSRRKRFFRSKGALRALPLVAATCCGGSATAQQNAVADTCVDIRASETRPLMDAVASREPDDITAALQTLAETRRFRIPVDPVNGRRPVRRSYAIRFSDRQLALRATRYVKTIERQTAWRSFTRRRSAGRRFRPGDYGGTIRSLLAIATAFPELTQRARQHARDIGDAVLVSSAAIGIPAIPLAPNARSTHPNAFMRAPLPRMLSTCPALRQSMASGWLVTAKAPEFHYGETARIGEALIALTRDTGEQRFLRWVREASGWYSRHPLAADIHANAMAAGLDAELYTVSAEDKYLIRALDRLTVGVLPAFDNGHRKPDGVPFVRRLPLADLADVTRALVHVATALAAAPAEGADIAIGQRVSRAIDLAHVMLQERASAGRRLQLPTQLIDLAFDIERAQRAGANIASPMPDVFRHVLAHGADRLQRSIPLSGAASGLLLAKLKERGWAGAYRTEKPTREATTATQQ